jgi:hypothetical protein
LPAFPVPLENSIIHTVARFGRPALPARRDQGSAAVAWAAAPPILVLDNLNESATLFDPCYRDGRMLDRSASHRSKFSEEVREQFVRRRANASAVFIDFAGSRIVANFGTLSANQHVASVDRIKRRLWDLKVDRDNAKGVFVERDHEMIVQHPSRRDLEAARPSTRRTRRYSHIAPIPLPVAPPTEKYIIFIFPWVGKAHVSAWL